MTMKRIMAGVLAILLGGALAGYSVADEEAEEGARPDSVDGSGIQSVDGSGIQSVDGSGIDSAEGGEAPAEEEVPEEGESEEDSGE